MNKSVSNHKKKPTFKIMTSKTNHKLPRGIFAASLTPLKSNLSIDAELMLEHCLCLLENGCDGLVIFGTTGEANSFSVRERIELLDALLGGGLPPHKLLVGTGCCALPDSVELTQHAVKNDVGGVLVLPPFYYKNISDEGIFYALDRLIQEVKDERLRVYLYHFPKMAIISFSPSLIRRMFETFPNIIIGMKDSSGDFENMKTNHNTFPGFDVYAGTEQILSEILQIGAAGCVSASINLTSRLAARVKNAFPSEESTVLQKKLNAVRKEFEKYPMIPALKQMMARKTGHIGWTNLRPPLVSLNEPDGRALEEALDALQFSDYCSD